MNNASFKLEQILKTIPNQLMEITDEQSAVKPAFDKWSKKEILGHLIDSAVNNHQRFVRLQSANDLSLPGYNQNEWVVVQGYQNINWQELIALWKIYNMHLLHVIRIMDQTKLDNTCNIGGNPSVTLRFIVEDYVVHMAHHLKEIFKSIP